MLHDHVIIGRNRHTSLRDSGLISAVLGPDRRRSRLGGPADGRHDLLRQDLQLVEREVVRHARPMHRGADVVDPEPPVEPDHLLGDFGWRTDQKAVFQQLGEIVVEIMPAGMTLSCPQAR